MTAKPCTVPALFGGDPVRMRAVEAPRLPGKEAQLCALIRRKPLSLDRLRAEPWVKRKIGVGYLDSLLRYLLNDGRITVTDGVFWARPLPTTRPGVRPARRGPFS